MSCKLFSDNTSEAVERLQSLFREIDNSADPFIDSFLIYGGCGDHILKRHSGRVEDDDFVRRCTSGFYSG
jgi:hypothetical protein